MLLSVAEYSSMRITAGQSCITITHMARFDADSAVPLYVQAADYIAGLIEAGEMAPGARVPSERDLAIEWEMAPRTVARAMQELRDRGLVVTTVGKGTFVSK
jgi:GntR family transcriptional regulator